VNPVMNLLFPQKVGYILTSCTTGSFSRWTLLHGVSSLACLASDEMMNDELRKRPSPVLSCCPNICSVELRKATKSLGYVNQPPGQVSNPGHHYMPSFLSEDRVFIANLFISQFFSRHVIIMNDELGRMCSSLRCYTIISVEGLRKPTESSGIVSVLRSDCREPDTSGI
jgi:hypothetical protein